LKTPSIIRCYIYLYSFIPLLLLLFVVLPGDRRVVVYCQVGQGGRRRGRFFEFVLDFRSYSGVKY